jgi:hypothetical protein
VSSIVVPLEMASPPSVAVARMLRMRSHNLSKTLLGFHGSVSRSRLVIKSACLMVPYVALRWLSRAMMVTSEYPNVLSSRAL